MSVTLYIILRGYPGCKSGYEIQPYVLRANGMVSLGEKFTDDTANWKLLEKTQFVVPAEEALSSDDLKKELLAVYAHIEASLANVRPDQLLERQKGYRVKRRYYQARFSPDMALPDLSKFDTMFSELIDYDNLLGSHA